MRPRTSAVSTSSISPWSVCRSCGAPSRGRPSKSRPRGGTRRLNLDRQPTSTALCARSGPLCPRSRFASSIHVRVRDVLLHHSMRVEEGGVECDRALEISRSLGYARPPSFLSRPPRDSRPNGPTGDPLDASFQPPSVEDAQTGDAIVRGLHTGRTGRFQRRERRVEP